MAVMSVNLLVRFLTTIMLMLITSSGPHPRPNGDGDKDDGYDDPDDEIGCWEWPGICRYFSESNNAGDDDNDGQCQGNSQR